MKTIKYLLASIVITHTLSVNAELDGAQLYMQNCMVCHADDGAGAMPGVSDLSESTKWKSFSDKQLIEVLNKGVNKPGATVVMPAKGGNPDLTNSELKAIVLFLRNEL